MCLLSIFFNILCCNFYSSPLPIFKPELFGGFVVVVVVLEVLCMFWIVALYQMYDVQISLSFCVLPFHFHPWMHKSF